MCRIEVLQLGFHGSPCYVCTIQDYLQGVKSFLCFVLRLYLSLPNFCVGGGTGLRIDLRARSWFFIVTSYCGGKLH